MKKFFTLLICCSVASVSFSQMRLALTGGPHYSSVLEKNSLPNWEATTKPGYETRGGFNAGVLAEIPLGNKKHWFLQPGLYYMTKGRKYTHMADTALAQTDTLYQKNTFYPNYIDIPLNLTYKIPLGKRANFFVSAGPYVSFFYTGKQSTETKLLEPDNSTRLKKSDGAIEAGSETWKVKTFDYGVNARVGFEFGSFIVSGYASQGLNNFYHAPYDGDLKHRVTGVTVGFWLNKHAKPESKPRDSDGDGIPDERDHCPNSSGPLTTNGCPDRDGDGIADHTDKCPDLPGLARYHGCPVPDTDKDGINDEEDKCPLVPGLEKYQGCPVPDTDGDGVNDELDKCPTVPGPVSNQGCPIPDTDGDGVNDRDDKCPRTPGSKANDGCPLVKKEIVEKVNFVAQRIFFARNSYQLTEASRKQLNKIVGILKDNPDFIMNIEGHSDNTGWASLNLNLSQKRSDAVKAYLVKLGIDASRVSAVGYGQERPVADNGTPEGRSRNRRVEMNVTGK
ncbi:MAG: OmpA family protein [Candidatus Pseudobacter hemicellulosilyticus]|uniref:OmpA family protein n=1 Tax=Candidatus Pseudobacter hemicellulosilyticus TaxID=3121375 RepID=A0AAJ5WP46_9BACT|nr:MAG: OmpA family protein [Pseudobacter sp.]